MPHTALPRRVIGGSTDGRGRLPRAVPLEPFLLRACDVLVGLRVRAFVIAGAISFGVVI